MFQLQGDEQASSIFIKKGYQNITKLKLARCSKESTKRLQIDVKVIILTLMMSLFMTKVCKF